jgi:methylmalonyl-CoA mutase N-terminal domain/subunit
MTYQQPLNNLVRGTVMALAGVLGGAQSLGVSGYDEAISVPSEHAHQMSVRIQQILQVEAGLTDVVDPLGGSYYVEALTDELESRAWAFFDDIIERGGFLATLDSGWLHGRAQENQIEQWRKIDAGQRSVVGLNIGLGDVGSFEVEGFTGGAGAWDNAMHRLNEVRASRESRRHADSLRDLAATCRSEANIMPAMMEAVAADATLGDIGAVFRDVFGDWSVPLKL